MKEFAWVAMIFLGSCSSANTDNLVASGELFRVERLALKVDLVSSGETLFCVPSDQFSDFYGAFRVKLKNGGFAEKHENANKAIQIVGGVDLADGVYVVGSQKKKVYPSIDNFVTEDAEVDYVDMHLTYFKCNDITKPKIPTQSAYLKFKLG